MEEARALFRNADATQFVIVTIPTAMAAAESVRLAKALLQEQARTCTCLHMHDMRGTCAVHARHG